MKPTEHQNGEGGNRGKTDDKTNDPPQYIGETDDYTTRNDSPINGKSETGGDLKWEVHRKQRYKIQKHKWPKKEYFATFNEYVKALGISATRLRDRGHPEDEITDVLHNHIMTLPLSGKYMNTQEVEGILPNYVFW